MPSGTITKIVHLTLQSSFSTESSPQSKGYGYLTPDVESEKIYFAAKAVKGFSFDDLQVGQQVDFEEDSNSGSAKSVSLRGPVLEPPSPQVHTE